VRAIASGVAPFLIIAAFISATIRSDASRTLDAAARARLRTINTAEVMHRGQAQRFGSIEDLIRLGLVDSGIRSGYGYKFTLSADENDYTAKATSASKYGCWDYSSKSDGVVRYSADQSRAPKGQSGQPVP
jgi:hypothetical protein